MVFKPHVLDIDISGNMVQLILYCDDGFPMAETKHIKTAKFPGGISHIGCLTVDSEPVDHIQGVVKKVRIDL